MEKDCIFCKIVNGEIPTTFLYKNDDLVVFRDINPHAPVHILIVPTRHIRSVNDLTGRRCKNRIGYDNGRKDDGRKRGYFTIRL